MKTLKRILLVLLTVIIFAAANLVYYLTYGQFRSVEKLKANQELTIYECCSIYSLHLAVGTIGAIISPEAAEQARLMCYKKTGSLVTRNNSFFLKSNTVRQQIKQESLSDSFMTTIKFSQKDFQPASKEARYALAIDGADYHYQLIDNGDEVSEIKECTVLATYGNYTGHFKIAGIHIKIHYQLMRYLQQKGWLHVYTIRYLAD